MVESEQRSNVACKGTLWRTKSYDDRSNNSFDNYEPITVFIKPMRDALLLD